MRWPFSGEVTSVSCYQLELLAGGLVQELASKEDRGEAPVVFSTFRSLFILSLLHPDKVSPGFSLVTISEKTY